MKIIERNHNVLTGEEDLEHLYTFSRFPVFMGCVGTKQEKDLTLDMNWWISKKTGLIQLNPLVPLDVLYSQSHDSGVVGKLWAEHHAMFSSFISEYGVSDVLEIGAGHGDLCRNYLRKHKNAKWTIVEPNPKIESGGNITVIRGLFESKFNIPKGVDTVVHSHVIEHLYEPMELIRDISNKLKEGDLHLFSMPRLEEMLKRKYTNCINFEHTLYLTEEHVEYILAVCGFHVIEKRYFKDDHSIFYATRKIKDTTKSAPLSNLYEKNKAVFSLYIESHKKLIEELNALVRQHNGSAYLFGGHVFSQYLIGFGLDESDIECILDNDPNKHGKRLYGTSLTVNSPEILTNAKNAAVILRAGVYNEEIKRDIEQNINPNVLYWE